MNGCILYSTCAQDECDESCPNYAQISYLLDRNRISLISSVYKMSNENYVWAQSVLCNTNSVLSVVESPESYKQADILTYAAICNNWKGSQLHCTVYHLNFSSYMDSLRDSWNSRSSEDHEYMKIFIESAKILIISGLGYMNFRNTESQNFLHILDYRQSENFKTIVVCPKIDNLVGDGTFFTSMKSELENNRYYGNVD